MSCAAWKRAPTPTRGPQMEWPLCILQWREAPPAMVMALLEAGADPKAKDAAGRVPWDYAKDNRALKGTDVYWQLHDARFE